MAGIGFTLKHMLSKGTISGVAESYLYAGVIGSGPWLLSVVAIFATSLLASGSVTGRSGANDFQVSVTYMMVASLLLTSFLQLVFTRFIADCLYAKDEAAVRANLLGAVMLTIVAATTAGLAAWAAWPTAQGPYALLMITGFAILQQDVAAITIDFVTASSVKFHYSDGAIHSGVNVIGQFNGGAGGVPEPASWALMISGFGLAGATLRSRRRQSLTFA